MRRFFFMSVIFLNVTLQASSMFTLSGVKSVYVVVEIRAKSVPKSFKADMIERINEELDTLKIRHDNYDQRAFALIINEYPVDNAKLITIKLGLGEQVLRLDTKEKTFALTYESSMPIVYHKGDDIEDKLEDALNLLLDDFSEQYVEEQKKIEKATLKEGDFASIMGYETHYKKALAKAKKLKKPLLLVLVANYCPWCRKFENRVLSKKEVNRIIQNRFVALIINKEKEPFPKRFNKNFTPIVHFIDYKTQKSYKTIVGYNNKEAFLRALKEEQKKH